MILEEKNTIKRTDRIYYLDVLRVIACLSVIMIHTSCSYKDFGTFNGWIGNIFNGLSRIGVPLFVMISGALMLDKNYNYNTEKLIKHIKRMVVFFVFWSALYCIMYQVAGQIIMHKPLDIVNIIGCFIKGHYHLWFIYLIVGLYLIVPLLRLWVKNENKKQIEYFIILSIIFTYMISQIIRIGSNYSSLFEHINDIIEEQLFLDYVGGYTTYFILGWYIHNYDVSNKKIIYALGMIGYITTVIGTYILSVSTGKEINMYGNLYLNVFFQSLMVFLYIKTKFYNNESGKNKLIVTISKYSLGIYAIHAIGITIMNIILFKIGFDNAIINIPIVFLFSFILALLGTYILSKIPVLKRIV